MILQKNPDWVTIIYIIRDSHIHLIRTKDGKTHKFQEKTCIGVNMSKEEFKKRRLKVRQHSETIYFSTRKIIVTSRDTTKASLCRQGWIRLGLIPEPDYIQYIKLTPEVTIDVPVVNLYLHNKRLTFINDEDKKILLALIGKTLICVGHNKFEILEK